MQTLRQFASPAPYFHVLPNGQEIHHDGLRCAEADDPAQSNRHHFQTFADRVVTLAIAHHMLGDDRAATRAAALVRAWFLEPSSRMNPNACYAQYRSPDIPNFTGIVEFRDLWGVLDALRILSTAKAITQVECERFAEWLRLFRDSWVTSDAGKRAAIAGKNIAVINELVVVAISAYIGDRAMAVSILAKSPLRMHRHFEPFGVQLAELSRTRPLNYSLFNLQLGANIASLARSIGVVDLWQCGRAEHKSLAWAVRFLCLNRSLFPDYADRPEHFDQRLGLLMRTIPEDAADYEVLAAIPLPSHRTGLIDYRDGVPPLWCW